MKRQFGIDFVTVVSSSGLDEVGIVQKSRLDDLHDVIKVTVKSSCTAEELNTDAIFLEAVDGGNKVLTKDNKNKCFVKQEVTSLRQSALLYLHTRKSLLADMTLPVAILSEEEEKFLTRSVVGNQTVYDGYSVALLNTVADSLGFDYQFVSVDDGGYYGTVLDNGEATGITGQLARREAALSTMPLSRTDIRSRQIDFIMIPIAVEDVTIIYRSGWQRRLLPIEDAYVDVTYLDIIQPEFCLYLIGPLLFVGALGAVIHVLTSSCHSSAPGEFTKQKMKSLTTFPDHICFHTERKYKVQSGLILRTSWAIFWFILSSAYSAYLVTTFTVKTPELSIKTFKQLLDHPDYKFGMVSHDTALQTFLMASEDKTLKQVWKRMVDRNKTDPSTFSSVLDSHLQRVLQGSYALISETQFDLLPVKTYPDVRSYPQRGFEEINNVYVSTPKNIFYTGVLSNLLLSFQEMGIFTRLKMAYFAKDRMSSDSSQFSENKAVTFHRIQLPVYFAAAGLAFGVLVLVFEIVVYRCTHHKYTVTGSERGVRGDQAEIDYI
ncbi:glutamate receptor ionotropic, kainate 3-like [Physella acuta]|uniref:glutamate receptor ionotropic, kainate 3-like n=1 Tax=Physella acuta TaxID=109671 RepID=UPI0027DBCA73|nr:glutamate receptor ionotropic, kainate 3-like [Physella acuta]